MLRGIRGAFLVESSLEWIYRGINCGASLKFTSGPGTLSSCTATYIVEVIDIDENIVQRFIFFVELIKAAVLGYWGS